MCVKIRFTGSSLCDAGLICVYPKAGVGFGKKSKGSAMMFSFFRAAIFFSLINCIMVLPMNLWWKSFYLLIFSKTVMFTLFVLVYVHSKFFRSAYDRFVFQGSSRPIIRGKFRGAFFYNNGKIIRMIVWGIVTLGVPLNAIRVYGLFMDPGNYAEELSASLMYMLTIAYGGYCSWESAAKRYFPEV